jgi:predicted transcriptional regulator of viral defense system
LYGKLPDVVRSIQLYALKRRGVIEQISQGVYRLAEWPALADPDLVTVGLCLPRAVICFVSALAWYELTTQIPHLTSGSKPSSSASKVRAVARKP